jgi:hypothetical protein
MNTTGAGILNTGLGAAGTTAGGTAGATAGAAGTTAGSATAGSAWMGGAATTGTAAAGTTASTTAVSGTISAASAKVGAGFLATHKVGAIVAAAAIAAGGAGVGGAVAVKHLRDNPAPVAAVSQTPTPSPSPTPSATQTPSATPAATPEPEPSAQPAATYANGYEIVWTYARDTDYGYTALVAGDVVLAFNSGNLEAGLDLASGEVLWEAQDLGLSHCDAAQYRGQLLCYELTDPDTWETEPLLFDPVRGVVTAHFDYQSLGDELCDATVHQVGILVYVGSPCWGGEESTWTAALFTAGDQVKWTSSFTGPGGLGDIPSVTDEAPGVLVGSPYQASQVFNAQTGEIAPSDDALDKQAYPGPLVYYTDTSAGAGVAVNEAAGIKVVTLTQSLVSFWDSPHPDDLVLVLGNEAGVFEGLDPATGATEWTVRTGLDQQYVYGAWNGGGYLAVVDIEGNVAALPMTGEVAWETTVPFHSSGLYWPAISFLDEWTLVVETNTSESSSLATAFDIRTGQVAWTVETSMEETQGGTFDWALSQMVGNGFAVMTPGAEIIGIKPLPGGAPAATEPSGEPSAVANTASSYYRVFDGVSSFDDAAAHCTAQGGYLATISSEAENAAAYSYLTAQGFDSAYFGYRLAAGGAWEWLRPEGDAAYTNWHEGEPNNEGGAEGYAMFYWQFADGTWNDGDFGQNTNSDPMAFLCEFPTAAAAQAAQAPAPAAATTPGGDGGDGGGGDTGGSSPSPAAANRCPYTPPLSAAELANAGASCAWGYDDYCDCVNL